MNQNVVIFSGADGEIVHAIPVDRHEVIPRAAHLLERWANLHLIDDLVRPQWAWHGHNVKGHCHR